VGSSLSLRRFARCGKSMSVVGAVSLGASLSVLDVVQVGARVAVGGATLHGSTFSVFDKANFGASLSVRSLVRFGSALTSDSLHFGGSVGASYIRYTGGGTPAIEAHVANARGLSVTQAGGVLHGVWSADNTVTSSDRRLKRSIVPLYKAIAESASKAGIRASSPHRPPGMERASTVDWVLRQLRPVSFKFKHGPEGKYSRYGFVAQELQQVLPSVVRGQGDKHLSVVYQDMIALLTLAAQVLQDKVNQQEESIANIMKYVKALDEKMDSILAKQQEDISKIEHALLVQQHNVTTLAKKDATTEQASRRQRQVRV